MFQSPKLRQNYQGFLAPHPAIATSRNTWKLEMTPSLEEDKIRKIVAL